MLNMGILSLVGVLKSKTMSSRIIAIANQKGGVGKTTTAHNLGAGLAREGHRVLLIDLDPQGNLSAATDCTGHTPDSYDMLIEGSLFIADSKAVPNAPKLFVIPSSPKLSGIDIELADKFGSEYFLSEALAESGIADRYDYIVIDTPPALGKLTINALTAAGGLIIPVQADMFSLQGFLQIFDTVRVIRKYTRSDLRILGILIVRHKQTVLSRNVEASLCEIAAKYGTKVFSARIADRVAVREAQMRQTDIFSYKPYCAAAIDYRNLVKEVLDDG